MSLVRRLPCPVPLTLAALLVVAWLPAAAAQADPGEWRNIGYSQLRDALGEDVPTGRGVRVALVEGGGTVDRSHRFFRDKNLINGAGTTDSTPSTGHANTCGGILCGDGRSIAHGVRDLELWLSNMWVNTVGRGATEEAALAALAQGGARVASHSYVADMRNPLVLYGLDKLVDRYDYLQVVGIPNGGNNPFDLWGSAFNAITCGKTNGTHPSGTNDLGAVYAAGRTKPDLVGPLGVTSNTTPLIASAAALLIGMSQDNHDLSRGSYTSASGQTIRHAGAPEVVKAVLMAAADRRTTNDGHANFDDWGTGDHLASNGLDKRFGAGQLNVYHAHRILTAGEQVPGERDVDNTGFAYNRSFGAGETPTYFFRGQDHDRMQAVLTWHLDTTGAQPVLHDIDLVLWDATDRDPANWTEISRSACTINNTESVALTQMRGDRRYALQVVAKNADADFTWPYALAWRTDAGPRPDTEPPTIELHAPAWGTWITGPTTIRATAEDNNPGVTVQFFVNDEPFGDVQRSAPFEITIDPADFSGRDVRVGALARDAAGNETQAREIRLELTEDRRPPTVSVRDRFRDGQITFSIRARDRHGIRSIVIERIQDGEAHVLERFQFDDGRGDASVEFVFDTAGLAAGIHEFRITATDLAGNEGTQSTRFRQQ